MDIPSAIDNALCEYGATHLTPYIIDMLMPNPTTEEIEKAVTNVLANNEGTIKMLKDIMFEVESVKYNIKILKMIRENTIQDVLTKTGAKEVYVYGKKLEEQKRVDTLPNCAVELHMDDNSTEYCFIMF